MYESYIEIVSIRGDKESDLFVETMEKSSENSTERI
jgi:hypothetical protein